MIRSMRTGLVPSVYCIGVSPSINVSCCADRHTASPAFERETKIDRLRRMVRPATFERLPAHKRYLKIFAALRHKVASRSFIG